MCSDDSWIGILISTLGVIYEISRQQPIEKKEKKYIISSPQTISTTKREKLNKKISTENLKKKRQGVPKGF